MWLWRRWSIWWQQRPSADQVIWVSLVVATLLAYPLRVANLRPTLQFLADQGRDALIALGIMHGDIALVGPGTSVGSMYLGPLYYYAMVPFLWLGRLDPLAPAYGTALVGVLTVPLLYLVGSRLIGRLGALLATLLYVTAPYVVEYTRFSWNPNPAPFVTLLLLWSVQMAWERSSRWWIAVAVWVAVLSQLHYVALIMCVPVGLVWLADVRRHVVEKRRGKPLALATFAAAAVLGLSVVPLVIFDWRFDHIIAKGFTDFLFTKEKGLTPMSSDRTLLDTVRETHGRSMQVLVEIWGREWGKWYRQVNTLLVGFFLAVWAAGWWQWRRSRYGFGTTVLLISFLATAVSLSFYRSTVFFHYITFFYPIAYLLIGWAGVLMARWWGRAGRGATLALMAFILMLSVLPAQMRYLVPTSWQVSDMQRVGELIAREVPNNKSYALAVLSEVQDYRGLNYRYFLQRTSHPPVPLEAFGNADLLVIIAENPHDPTNVLGSPVYEVVVFPKGPYRTVDVPGGPLIYIVERESSAAH